MSAAWLFFVFTLVTAAGAHLIATVRSPGGDCGAYWASVLSRVSLWLGIPLLAAAAIRNLAFARDYLPPTSGRWLMIAGAAWLIVLAVTLLQSPDPAEGRWIAGTLEFSPRRYWVLGFFAPFLPALVFNWSQWPEDIFAAHWALVVMLLAMLGGIAFSGSPASVAMAGSNAAQKNPVALSPWPDEMRSRGVPLEDIASWEPSMTPEPASGPAAEWQLRLASAGSAHVSSVLCEAVARLVWSPPKQDRLAVVLGPDGCGQEEVTALVASELSRRHNESTLVITSAPDPALAKRLAAWLGRIGGENPISMADLSSDAWEAQGADLLLTDSETLSNLVLDQLRTLQQQDSSSAASGPRVGRLGLVVWWNAHEFSGVLAAHVWAVSRRLERLLRARRGPPARAVVFARPPADREGLFLGFLEHLLPYPLRHENTFQIAPDFARKTNLYRLGSRLPGAAEEASRASLLTDWPTLPAPASNTRSDSTHGLAESANSAGARILELQAPEVLALRQIICRGGRDTAANLDHHVAVVCSDNPYADFLVGRHGNEPDHGASVNLVSAEGRAELVRRHLLLALREAPDTMTGLRETFRWEETLLKNMLQQLSDENRLSRRPVRFLDDDGSLRRDSRYANQNPGMEPVSSFRTIGQKPVEVRDRNVRDRVLMHVDPERLTIEAYPGRVIESLGRRYRVLPWSGSPDRIECASAPGQISTWRIAAPRVSSVQTFGERLIFSGVSRYTARVDYHEDVIGVFERHADGSVYPVGIPRVHSSFRTEALILEFTRQFDQRHLIGAAAALSHVLPVHVAVDEDALKVSPVLTGSGPGLAIVDLYPGGIGVVNAIHKTVWLIPMLFDQAALWLSAAAEAGAQAALTSPLIRSMGIDSVDVRSALTVFQSAGWQRR